MGEMMTNNKLKFHEVVEEHKQEMNDLSNDIEEIQDKIAELDKQLNQVSTGFKSSDLKKQRKIHDEKEFLQNTLERADKRYMDLYKQKIKDLLLTAKEYSDEETAKANDETSKKDKKAIIEGINKAEEAVKRLKKRDNQALHNKRKIADSTRAFIIDYYKLKGLTDSQIRQIRGEHLYELRELMDIDNFGYGSSDSFKVVHGVPTEKELNLKDLLK